MSREVFHMLLQSQPVIIASYEGTGAVEMASGRSIAVDFELLQVEDGDCMALCTVIDQTPLLALEIMFGQPARLVGVSGDGRNVEFSTNLIMTQVNGSYIELHGQFITASTGAAPQAVCENQRVRATLTNVVCLSGGDTPNAPRLIITADPRFHASISTRPNYDESMKWLRLLKGVRATAEIQIQVASPADLTTVEGYLLDLCVLLSFGQGMRVAWIHYDVFDEQGMVVYTKHGRAITGRYVNLPVIPLNCFAFRSFLNDCLQPYRQSRPTLDLKLAIDMITAAKQEGNYLEARALQLIAAMEFIKGQVLRASNMLTVVEDDKFSAVLSLMQKRVEDAVSELLPDLSNDQKQKLCSHVQGFNWYPFRAALRQVCKMYSVNRGSKSLGRFVNIRNKLVHEYAFDPVHGTQMEQLLFLESFVTRIVLSALQYQGEFYDWSYHPKDGSPKLLSMKPS